MYEHSDLVTINNDEVVVRQHDPLEDGYRMEDVTDSHLEEMVKDDPDLDKQHHASSAGEHWKAFWKQLDRASDKWSDLDRHCMWLLRRSIRVLQNCPREDSVVRAAVSQALSDAARDLREGKEP